VVILRRRWTRGIIFFLVFCLGLILTSPWWGRLFYPLRYKEVIARSSRRYNLDPYLLTALIYEESKFDSESRSKVGAVGLMQLMPETAQWVARKIGKNISEEELTNPETNIDIGSWYLKFLLDKYSDKRLALAAYNSGHVNVDKWLKSDPGRSVEEIVAAIPFKETKEFVYRVLKSERIYRILYSNYFD
jgi:soluble lytic murein transglycosylase